MDPSYLHSILVVLGAFAIFLIVSVGVILVLWIAMPFSVFGTKPLLKKLIQEQEKTNKLLKTILDASLYREAYKEKDEIAEKRDDLH
ncbi:MAG: hypothetical protein HYV24_05005 [Deltaproteobacteria bacterium]|nr:hypothetical protein [Deltaproteobacteria bacterium]